MTTQRYVVLAASYEHPRASRSFTVSSEELPSATGGARITRRLRLPDFSNTRINVGRPSSGSIGAYTMSPTETEYAKNGLLSSRYRPSPKSKAHKVSTFADPSSSGTRNKTFAAGFDSGSHMC